MYRLTWLSLFAWLIVSAASAQVADSPEYTVTVREALAEFNDGHYPEARALFRHAHELQPSARTLRSLGISSFELREYEDAALKLEDALASDVKPLEGTLRNETQELLDRTYAFLGRYQLSVQPSFALLLVDGVESDLRSGQRLLLSIGHHQLEARAPAYDSDLRTLDVTGGEHTGLSFTLTEIPIPPTPAAPLKVALMPPEQPRTDRPLYKNPWLWTATGVVVVAAVVTAVALSGRDTHTRERDPYLTGPNVSIVSGLGVAR